MALIGGDTNMTTALTFAERVGLSRHDYITVDSLTVVFRYTSLWGEEVYRQRYRTWEEVG